jgi:ABC-2 type transport system permease protein
VLGKGISQVTGQSALYASVPMGAMVGVMTGSTAAGVALLRERTDGLLTRLWVLPIHRASGLLSRFTADAVRILVITVVILCVGLALGFRFRQGILESVAWLFVPAIFGLAFGMLSTTLALYTANTTLVEAITILSGLLMFFSPGFVPLSQFPRWLQPAVEHQPLTYAIEAMRGLSLGGPVLSPMAGLLLWAGGTFAVCLIPMAYGYRRASRRG